MGRRVRLQSWRNCISVPLRKTTMATRTSAGGESAITNGPEFDGFRIDAGDPLAPQHRLLAPFVEQALQTDVWGEGVAKVPSVKALLKRPADEILALTLAVTQRLAWHQDRFRTA